ncbi:MAG: UMP kinase, partial [Candidatus Diapherotrites archaeon]|nr:UMP kinase [Candidatus Diapherotrites archaeon]
MKKIIISMGGSVLFDENLKSERIEKFALMVTDLKKEGFEIGVVVGGGKICGKYVEAARNLGANEFFCDDLGIRVTRVNALLFIKALGDVVSPQVVTDFFEAKKIMDSGKIVVMGGMMPSLTTDAVASLLAEFVESDLVNVTNVRGVYSDDPSKNKDAKFYDKMSFEEMILLSSEKDSRRARSNFVFDAMASKIIARSKVKTSIVGSDSIE